MRKGEIEDRFDAEYYRLINLFSFKSIYPAQSIGSHFYVRDGDHNKFPPEHNSNAQNGVRYLRAQDIKDDTIIDENPIYVSKEYFSKIKRSEIKGGYILFSIMASVGGVVVYPENRETCTANRAVGILVPKTNNIILPHYFKTLFNTNFGESLIQTLKKGGVQQRINLFDFSNLKIPVPPFEVQTQIIEKFETAYNVKRAKETEAKSLLDGIDAYLLERLCIETPAPTEAKKTFFVRLSNVSGNRLDCLFHQAILFNNFNSQFPTVALNKLVSTFCGGTPDKSNPNYWNGDIFWVSPKDFRGLEISKSEDTITEEGLKKSSTKLVAAENVLIVVRSGILQHTLPVAVNKIDTAINQDVKALEIKDKSKLNPYYLTFYLNTFQDRLLPMIVKHGTIVQSVNTEQFDKLQIPIPPLKIQEEIAAHIQSIRTRAKELERDAHEEVERAKREVEQMILGEARA